MCEGRGEKCPADTQCVIHATPRHATSPPLLLPCCKHTHTHDVQPCRNERLARGLEVDNKDGGVIGTSNAAPLQVRLYRASEALSKLRGVRVPIAGPQTCVEGERILRISAAIERNVNSNAFAT